MLQRAEWRRLHDDPKSLLGWWWRAVRPRPLKFERIETPQLALRLVRMSTFAVLLVFLWVVLMAVKASWSLTLVLLLPLLWYWISSRWNYFREELPSSLLAVTPSPAVGEPFYVKLTLRRQGIATASEEAVATFLEGWLNVEGLRTSFCLRACDVGQLADRSKGRQILHLSEDQEVEFQTYRPEDRRLFAEAMRLWHYYSVESPEGASRLPPLEPFPTVVSALPGRRLSESAVAFGLILTPFSSIGMIIAIAGGGALVWNWRKSALQ